MDPFAPQLGQIIEEMNPVRALQSGLQTGAGLGQAAIGGYMNALRGRQMKQAMELAPRQQEINQQNAIMRQQALDQQLQSIGLRNKQFEYQMAHPQVKSAMNYMTGQPIFYDTSGNQVILKPPIGQSGSQPGLRQQPLTPQVPYRPQMGASTAQMGMQPSATASIPPTTGAQLIQSGDVPKIGAQSGSILGENRTMPTQADATAYLQSIVGGAPKQPEPSYYQSPGPLSPLSTRYSKRMLVQTPNGPAIVSTPTGQTMSILQSKMAVGAAMNPLTNFLVPSLGRYSGSGGWTQFFNDRLDYYKYPPGTPQHEEAKNALINYDTARRVMAEVGGMLARSAINGKPGEGTQKDFAATMLEHDPAKVFSTGLPNDVTQQSLWNALLIIRRVREIEEGNMLTGSPYHLASQYFHGLSDPVNLQGEPQPTQEVLKAPDWVNAQNFEQWYSSKSPAYRTAYTHQQNQLLRESEAQ